MNQSRKRVAEGIDVVVPPKKAAEPANKEILLVEGKEFIVDKKYLISISKYIAGALEGHLKNSGNFLSGIDAVDFQMFLGVLENKDCLSDENICDALELMMFLQSDLALGNCEKWMIGKCKLDINTKFQLADKYLMTGLKKSILNTISTVVAIKDILPDNIDDWTKETVTLALEKVLGYFGLPRSKEKRTDCEVEAEQKIFQLQIDALEKIATMDPPGSQKPKEVASGDSKKDETDDAPPPEWFSFANVQHCLNLMDQKGIAVEDIVQLPQKERFEAAVTHGLDFYKNAILDKVPTVYHMKRILPEDISTWDKGTSRMVLERSLALCGIPGTQKNIQRQVKVLKRLMERNSRLLERHREMKGEKDMARAKLEEKLRTLEEQKEELDRVAQQRGQEEDPEYLEIKRDLEEILAAIRNAQVAVDRIELPLRE